MFLLQRELHMIYTLYSPPTLEIENRVKPFLVGIDAPSRQAQSPEVCSWLHHRKIYAGGLFIDSIPLSLSAQNPEG